VGFGEGLADLTIWRPLWSEPNRWWRRRLTRHVEAAARAEEMIGLIREGQQLVVIDLHDERDFVAYLRATEPSTPKVEATALQPPSMASLTMFPRQNNRDFSAKLAPPECSMPWSTAGSRDNLYR